MNDSCNSVVSTSRSAVTWNTGIYNPKMCMCSHLGLSTVYQPGLPLSLPSLSKFLILLIFLYPLLRTISGCHFVVLYLPS